LNRAFYIILLAQFLSALADNALLFAAIGLLVFFSAPEWFSPLLQTVFVVAYIVLAPLAGPFADALPKGRVMLIANTVKFTGCPDQGWRGGVLGRSPVAEERTANTRSWGGDGFNTGGFVVE
jgi:MFS family permease